MGGAYIQPGSHAGQATEGWEPHTLTRACARLTRSVDAVAATPRSKCAAAYIREAVLRLREILTPLQLHLRVYHYQYKLKILRAREQSLSEPARSATSVGLRGS